MVLLYDIMIAKVSKNNSNKSSNEYYKPGNHI